MHPVEPFRSRLCAGGLLCQRCRSDGQGGYWIEEIDEITAGNAYTLRTGGPQVDHRLQVGEEVVSLSAIAPP